MNQTDNLKIDYYVRYLHSDKQVKAEISFSEVIDSTKKLLPKRMKEVLFQNNALDEKKSTESYKYRFTKKIPFVDTCRFVYRNNTQQINLPPVIINPIDDFSIKKNKVSKLGGTNITVMGNPLQKQESIVILISDANNKTVTFLANALSIEIVPEKIGDLSLGQGTIYAVRKQRVEDISTIQQLTGLTEYYSEVKIIEIVE